MKILHNPRCRKSRETLGIIRESGMEPEIVEYLKSPPTEEELILILKQLGLGPLDIIRKGEALFKEQFKGKELTDAEWISVMVQNPILIERPIVISEGRAVLGRPPAQVKELL